MDTQLNSHERQAHLLDAKERILGSIEHDRTSELSEIEYLNFEIQEITEKRRSYSMPLFAIGIVIGVFATAADTQLTQIGGFIFAFASLLTAFWIRINYTKQLERLEHIAKTLTHWLD